MKADLPGGRPVFTRRARAAEPTSLVREEPLREGEPLPLLVRPGADGVDLPEWAAEHREELEEKLQRHGGILFRGFAMKGAEDLDRFVVGVAGGPLEYQERSSPRTQVAGRIYTSTEHPADQEIFFHNEQSYNLVFPMKILFHCTVAPGSGGATPIADVRRVYRSLDPAIRERFEERGYMYVRNFGDGLGLTWQEAFQTEDPARVEAYCAENGIEVEWKDGGRLRTRQVRRTSARHPRSGEMAWFNHAAFFHRTSLAPAVRAALEAAFQNEDDFPNNTLYGDGAPIEPEVADALRSAYREATVRFAWEEGDLLLLDNMLTAHARDPFTGPRRILTAMADPFQWERVA